MKFNKEIDYFAMLTDERAEKLKNVLSKRQTDFTVVLENIHDPHNMSAVFRSCDAVGIYEVFLIYTDGRQFPKLGEKSSASARKWVNQRHYISVDECYADLRKEGKKIYTTHMAKDSVSLYELDLKSPVALVFGNEHSGVSEEATSKADGNFLIPQVGMIQSLNISVACAVSVYEVFRQRLIAGCYDQPSFPEPEFKSILNEWSAR